MSTAFLQVTLRDMAETLRIEYSGANPEDSIARIDMLKGIEVAYYRGIYSLADIEQIHEFMIGGLVTGDTEALRAKLEYLATYTGYTDDNFIVYHTEGKVSEAVVKHILSEHSDMLTQELVTDSVKVYEGKLSEFLD